MLIIRRLNRTDAASGIVTLKISEWFTITRMLLVTSFIIPDGCIILI